MLVECLVRRGDDPRIVGNNCRVAPAEIPGVMTISSTGPFGIAAYSKPTNLLLALPLGLATGRRALLSDTKKAIVTLDKEHRIDFF